mmetsp:Transcript_42941/g.142187  ORF Transcript_42941/g.142187 Transcript_42941/m.142187 type:complete len:203 (+) Transcript_42941:79-687(+)
MAHADLSVPAAAHDAPSHKPPAHVVHAPPRRDPVALILGRRPRQAAVARHLLPARLRVAAAREDRACLVGVALDIGCEVQPAAVLHKRREGLHHFGSHDTPPLGAAPRVREEDEHLVERAPRLQAVAQQSRRVRPHQPRVGGGTSLVEALHGGSKPASEPVDTDKVGVRVRRRKRAQRLAGAAPNLKHERRAVHSGAAKGGV